MKFFPSTLAAFYGITEARRLYCSVMLASKGSKGKRENKHKMTVYYYFFTYTVINKAIFFWRHSGLTFGDVLWLTALQQLLVSLSLQRIDLKPRYWPTSWFPLWASLWQPSAVPYWSYAHLNVFLGTIYELGIIKLSGWSWCLENWVMGHFDIPASKTRTYANACIYIYS